MDFFLYLTEIYFLFFLVIFFILGFITENFILFYIKNKTNLINYRITRLINFLFFIIVFYCILLLYNSISFNFLLFFNKFIVNKQIIFIKIFLFLFMLIFFILLNNFFIFYIKNENFSNLSKISEFLFLFLLSFYIFTFLVSSNDFVSIYIILEIQSFILYFIISFKKNSVHYEASIKYLLVGLILTTFFILGLMLLYSITGSLDFFELEIFLWGFYTNKFILISISLILLSFFIKLSFGLFFFWILDIYKTLSLFILLYLLVIYKFIIFFILFRIWNFLFYFLNYFYLSVLVLLIISSLWLGIVLVIFQTKIKKILIYSSIVNINFFFLGIFINLYFNFYLYFIFYLMYSLSILGIFLALFILNKILCVKKEIIDISQLINFYKINPVFALVFSSFFFSICGLPPFSGFIYKFFYIFSTFINSLYIIFFSILTLYIISIFYYIRIVKLIFVNFSFNHYYNFFFFPKEITFLIYFLVYLFIFNLVSIVFLGFIINIVFEYFIF